MEKVNFKLEKVEFKNASSSPCSIKQPYPQEVHYQHKLPLVNPSYAVYQREKRKTGFLFGKCKSASTSLSARLWCSHFLETHSARTRLSFSLCCLFPSNSITLPAVCFSRDSPAPLAHRQTAESVGTQHKLYCEAEVSESVGCISADRGTMKM